MTMTLQIVSELNCSPFLQPDHYITEASTLGIAPGHCPVRLETTLGNQQPFLYVGSQDGTAFYRQQFGQLSLAVFND